MKSSRIMIILSALMFLVSRQNVRSDSILLASSKPSLENYPQLYKIDSCSPVSSGLVSWWPGEGNTIDIINGNTGVPENGVSYSQGQVGQAFSFDGINDSIDVYNPTNLNMANTITLIAWVKPVVAPPIDDSLVTQAYSIISKWGQSTSLDSYAMYLRNPDGNIRLWGAIGGISEAGIYGGTIPVGEWSLVSMTYNSSTGMNKLFVNGSKVAETVLYGKINVSNVNLLIGKEDSIYPRYFHGSIDEVAIFDRELSEQEILSIYNSGSSGICKGPANQAHYIDLIVSIYKLVPLEERSVYENILGYFSDAIYEMSNGTQKVRTVVIYQKGTHQGNADILWLPSVWPNSDPAGFGHHGKHIWMADIFPFREPFYATIPANLKLSGYTLAHELGHYFYGLYDEYKWETKENDWCDSCPHSNDIPVIPSVMTYQWEARNGNYSWLNFSVATNTHNGQGKTAQDRVYKVSGWETLNRKTYYDYISNPYMIALPKRTYYPELSLVAPAKGQAPSIELSTIPTTTTRSNLNVNWIPVNILETSSITNTGFTYLANIDSLNGMFIDYPQPIILAANITKGIQITKASITTTVKTPDKSLVLLSLKDDGIAPDALANDGFYSGIMPYSLTGTYTITVSFDNHLGLAEYANIGAAYTIAPNGETYSPTIQLVGEAFTQTVTQTVIINGYKADDYGNTPQTSFVLNDDNSDLSGRIDYSGDHDFFQITSTYTGTMVVRVTNLALGMVPHLRVYDDDGITLLYNGYFQTESGKYLYAMIQTKKANKIYIDVSHTDENSSQGYYSISAGQPIPGSNEVIHIYLPVLIK